MITLTCEVSFDFDSLEYRHLLRRAQTTAFQQPDWLTAFYRHLVESPDVEPAIVVARTSESRELVALLPMLKRRVGEAILVEYAFQGVTDYACPIVATEAISELKHSNEARLRLQKIFGDHDVLRIEPVRQEDVSMWGGLLGADPESLDFGAHSVQFSVPFRQWRSQNLGPIWRSQLDRKGRRLADRGEVNLRIVSADEARAALSLAREFREGRFVNDPLQTDEGFRFYTQVAARGAKSGFARTYQMTCGDRVVAIAFGIVVEKQFCYLILGCDYETYARHSPGLLMLDRMMEEWASVGGRLFDFTIGDEPFKSVFRCQRRKMYRLVRANTRRGVELIRG